MWWAVVTFVAFAFGLSLGYAAARSAFVVALRVARLESFNDGWQRKVEADAAAAEANRVAIRRRERRLRLVR